MLSTETKEALIGLEIKYEEMSDNSIRLTLEDLVDSVEQLTNTEDHAKREAINRVYSLFMEDYTTMLDEN